MNIAQSFLAGALLSISINCFVDRRINLGLLYLTASVANLLCVIY